VKALGFFTLFVVIIGFAVPVRAGLLEECIAREVLEGDPQRTAAAIERLCRDRVGMMLTEQPPPKVRSSAVELRARAEAATEGGDYVITAYRPSYLMVTYNGDFDADDTPFAQIDPDFADFKKEEIKYQVSVKAAVARNLFGSDSSLFAGYTQTAWWQVFSDEGITSAPFREINHEPELFLRHYGGPELPFGGRIANLDLALVHESNGRSEFLSRSWNRLMGRFTADYGDLALLGRLWYRFPEDDDEDDNPAEYRYLGYGDIRAVWAPNRNTFTLMWRPGTEQSGTELTWSYPISSNLRVYAQWWRGYGESLLDYDREVDRFGIGVALNDFFMRNEAP